MKFTSLIAIIGMTQAIRIGAPNGTDPTGKYSPKDNMHTGYEGSKEIQHAGYATQFNDKTTGDHRGRVDYKNTNEALRPFRLGGNGAGRTGTINSDDTRYDENGNFKEHS